LAMTGVITKNVRNSARPISTWLGGMFCMPIALRMNDSTMMMRVKPVSMMSSEGASDSTVSSRSICTDDARSVGRLMRGKASAVLPGAAVPEGEMVGDGEGEAAGIPRAGRAGEATPGLASATAGIRNDKPIMAATAASLQCRRKTCRGDFTTASFPS
jgi:hypothetical protein